MANDSIHFDAPTIPITQLDLLFDILSHLRVQAKEILEEASARRGTEFSVLVEEYNTEYLRTRKGAIDEYWSRYNGKEIPLPPGVLAPRLDQ